MYKNNRNNYRGNYKDNKGNGNYRDNNGSNYKQGNRNNVNKDEYKDILNYIENPLENTKYDIFFYSPDENKSGHVYEFSKILIRRNISNSQLRKFYTNLVDIYENYKDKDTTMGLLSIMIPHLFYAKNRKYIPSEFFNFFTDSIGKLKANSGDEAKFKKSMDAFKEVLQAIVAYTTKESNTKEVKQ